MKIEQLTIRDIKTICKKEKHCSKSCPLSKHRWLCLGLGNMTERELKNEIEYDRELKIVGTTTLDKSLERFLVDNSKSVKNRLKAFELLVKNVLFDDEEKKSFTEITKEEIIEGYDEKFRSRFKLSLDELVLVFDAIKEVMSDEDRPKKAPNSEKME